MFSCGKILELAGILHYFVQGFPWTASNWNRSLQFESWKVGNNLRYLGLQNFSPRSVTTTKKNEVATLNQKNSSKLRKIPSTTTMSWKKLPWNSDLFFVTHLFIQNPPKAEMEIATLSIKVSHPSFVSQVLSFPNAQFADLRLCLRFFRKKKKKNIWEEHG